MILYVYLKCSTCKKAIKYINSYVDNIDVRDMVIDKLSIKEIDRLVKLSGLNIDKFFNTSGIKYRELHLKDKIKSMSYEDKLKLLSSDGMLIKRPILIYNNNVVLGYKEDKYNELLMRVDVNFFGG